MKKTLHFIHLIKKARITFCMLFFLLSSAIGFAQTITPTKTVTVAPGVCGALDVELKIQGSNPVVRPLEVVLVIDVSGSMGDGNNPKPLAYAQDAAIDFINKMFDPVNDPLGKNRVAIVTYSTTATIRQGLTLASGKNGLITIINGLTANGNTNIQDGLVKAKTVLDGATYDCATARSVVLLTDGVPNVTGTSGNGCSGSCLPAITTAANNIKTVTVSSTTYNNQIFSVGLFGAISGSDQTNAENVLNTVQSGGSFFTENAANLTGIYNQIFTQLSWVAKGITGTPFEKETVGANFTIGSVTVTKGTTTITGQEIAWNIDFLNVETITLKYRLTPKPNTCGSQQVSSSKLFFQNALCANATQDIVSPMTDVPCPIITIASQTNVTCYGGNNGAITLNTPTGGQGPYTYKWTKNDVDFATTRDISGLSAGTYKVSATDSNNCATGILTIQITQPAGALAIAASSKTDVLCYGASTGSVTAGTVTNSVGTVTYSWKNAANNVVGTTPSVSNLPAGTYTVTVTDSCSSKTDTVTIGQPNAVLVAAVNTKVDVKCKGDSTGSATASATGGTGTYSYSWNTVPVQTGATASGLKAGTYIVTVTDQNGCTDTETVTIGEPSNTLDAAIDSKTDVSCKGDSTGSATASATGGTASYSYSWNTVPVQTGATANGLKVGTYIVTVTDQNGCTDTETVTIGEPSNTLLAAIDSKTDVSCKGDATGSATASATGGTAGYSYSWNTVPVQTGATATNLVAGTYIVTVTDSKGCTDTETVTIGEPSNTLVAAIDSKTDVSCKGDATGSATASATGGTAGYSYSWNTIPVQTGATASNLVEGTYIVTVTDSKGCTDTETVTIGEPSNALLAAIDSKTDVSCKGDATGSATASATGGTAGYSYSWNTIPVQTGATASNLVEGTYIVTVTDSKGCTDTETVTIGEPSNALLAAIDSKTDVSCKGDATGSATASATGGTAGYSYSWNTVPVQTGATATNLVAGTYIVTVTDSKGCTDTETVTIGEPSNALLAAIDSKTDVSCKGDATGSATASATGGTAGYSYSWNTVPVQTGATASNLVAGTYIVTVTDSKGCTDTETVTIGEPSNTLVAAIDSKTDVSCKGDATGSATASATGGTAGYSYSWNTVPVQTGATATNLVAGTYIVTVTDSKGCTDTETVTIGEPSNALLTAIDSKTDVSCKGDATGSATASATGGTAGYSYSWNTVPVQTGATATNLVAGTYIVTVTDSKGCTDTETVTIGEPSNTLVAAIDSKTDVSCKGDATGSATASATGGTAGYSYSWNTVPVQTGATATNLVAGTYIVTVTDSKGCTDTETVTIGEPSNALLAAIDSKTDVSCKGDATGSATASATGGTAGYSYSWNTVPVQTGATATNLVAGTYIVTVTDSKGCTDTETVTIGEPSAVLSCSVVQNKAVTSNGLSDGEATVTPLGGNGGYTYLWDNNETTQKALALSAGLHSVTVTDSKGCKTTCTVTITEPNVLSCSITQDDPAKCYGDSNGKANVMPIGGNGEYTYLWDNGETTAQAIGLTAGTHEVTVTDKLGYKTKCSVVIGQPQAPLAAAIDSKTDVNCKGDATGSATASATGGNGTYSYTWNTVPAQNTATATNLVAGTYIVTVTDSKGCTDTETVTIGEPTNALLAAIDSKTDVSCKGDATGSATASATGGTAGYSYSWNTIPVQTGATATNLVAGTYIVTVTDSKGCADTETVTIGEPSNALLAAIDSKTDVSCKGDATGSATASATGGTAGYSYSWNTVPVQTGATATNLAAGTYIVTVTDSKGCTDTETVTIGEPSAVLSCSVVQNKAVTSNGLSDGEATVTPLGGNGGYTYLWDNNETTQKALALSAGLHSVTVTDSKGCKTTCTVTITEPNVLSCSITQDDPAKCYGDSNGKATVVPIGGNGEYTYLWDNGETTAQAIGLTAGTHEVTVTDKLGYKTKCSVVIGQPQAPLAAAIDSKTDVNCKGDATGSATASATGGNGTYSYTWNTVPVQNTATATNLVAGTYIVTVTDSKGCTDIETVTIGEPSNALLAAIDSKTDVSCKGDATGSATASATGGTAGYSYSWNTIPVQTGATASNLVAGTYIVTVTDSKGCTDTETVTIGEPSNALLAAIDSKTDVSCKGDATGSAIASATGGTAGYSYSWNTVPVQTGATATNLVAGTYIVTVTDSKGCTDTETVTIGEPSAVLSCSVVQNKAVTANGLSDGEATVTPLGGNGGYTYLWDNNETTQKALALSAGLHSVTVTDSKGCKTTCTVTITEPNVLSCSITQDDPAKCYGDSNGKATVVAIGGNGEYTYLWDNGETTAQAIGLTAGTHEVTVTDKLGYKTKCSVVIGQPQSPLTASITSKTDVNCKGDATGSATASATGGNGTYSYSWNTVPAQNTATATGLIAGTYIVTVTDAKGCTDTEQVIISEPANPLTASITSKTDVNCKGDATGSATASATGGTGTYSYSWNTNPVQTSATATNLIAGTYIVTVTDEKGCTDTEQVIISEPANPLTASITSKTDVNCKGDATGSATASATGGTGTYSYSWNTVPVQTSATATNLTAGTYIVTVTDEKGCTDTEQVIISEPQAPLTATKSQINPGCGGAATGSATVVASGGTAPYTYSWNTNPVQTTATASNLASGSYTVIITDAKGCTHSESFEIIDGDSILPVIDPLPATSTINCPAEPVFAQATATDLNGTISSLTYEDTVTPGDCAGSYTKTRTWTAKDACGNISLPVSQTIIVQDITAPTWKTEIASLNRTVECSNQQALASAQALFPTATDACDTDVSNIVKVSGQFMASEGCSNAGTYTNTWTVKDDCGNTSETFTQVITIQDTTAPTWTTQTASLNKTIECSDQEALASAQALFPTATDACDTDVSNIVKVSGQFVASEGCANSGTYTNTWTVKDDCGNTSATFTQVITIQDTTAPTWTTQTASLNKTIECSDQEALASAQALFPTATDACDTDVSNIVKVSGQFVASEGCANSGTYTNTWTVKDDCGNTSATFTQVITIEDTTAPTWTTQTASLNKTIECSDQEALASAQALFPTATDACDTDVSNVVKVSGQFVASEGCSNAGTYTNTWTVKDDCGNTSETFTQVITIQDTTKPVFNDELPSDITVSCDAVPEPANVQASDNCGGDLPIVLSEVKSDIKNECGTEYTLTRKWTTSDCSGNTASFTQIITVRDTTPPTGTAPANVAGLQSTAEIPTGSPDDITDEADNCGGNVTVTVSDSNNGANGCDGNAYVLTRTYTLTDCAGNKTELVQTFTVDNKVSVSGIPTNVSCLDGTDGSIAVTSSPGATVVITNANNEVVGNTNLPAGTYTLTATAPVNGEGQVCTATATVTITQPNYKVKVSGQVINVDTNTPIANVPVTLIPQGTTPGPILIRITNANGEYSFSGMVAGSYLVQVQDANLNSAYQLYPVNSSLFFTTLEECKFQVHDFLYGKSKLPVLGDYVWYDVNSDGIQNEWYDANNDGVVTKNIPDSNGAIDYSQWEWLDLNGDGSYTGPQNAGELNAGGFGNDKSANVIVDGPNGYHDEVIVGIQGFWRNRPESENPYGEYKVKLVRDANLDAVAAALGATGLVKVLPSTSTAKKATSKTGKIQMHTVCTTTSADGYIVNVTPEDLVHLDIDFGVNCKEFQDIVANDDNGGPFPGVNTTTPNVLNVLTNDTLEGQPVTASEVIITTVTPNEFLQLNPDGSVDILPNAPAGTLTMVYQICEADQTSNCDTATVTITIEAPVMTVTATAICVNDVPYLDYSATPVNFTPVNGVTITWADSNNNVVTTMTNLPLSGRVLWPGAVVDQNGNGIDWPGWVFQDNKWIQAPDGFENLRPTATVTISVNPSETIVVNYPPADPYCIARPTFAIVANDDTAGPINGTTGGINVINVYTNDTLNGSPVNPSDVTLTTVTPDPKGALTLNPDGSITVAPNTPAGTYTLTYQICENADFGNCDTAIVTVTVSSSPIVANDDSYTNIGCNRFGVVGNLLSNDLLNGLPVTLQLVNFSLVPQSTDVKSDPNITVDTAGNLTVGSATASGTYTYTYQICEKLNPNNCDTGTITITVIPNGVTTVSSSACNDDSTLVDLLALLPADTPRNGTWVDTNNTNALRDGILNALGLAIGNYAFEYRIADQNCPRSIVLNMEINDDCKVLPCENILVHNAFSPNGDGINDVFVIDGIGDLTCYPGNTVEIYNRWGILVFETTDYNNTTNAFDGTSRGRTTVKQSEGLPTGTYFYIVTYKSLDGNNVIQYNKKDGYLYLSK